jgi:hypothetical protein
MTIINVLDVYNSTHAFYLSGKLNGTIVVKLNHPINDTLSLSVSKTNNFNDLLHSNMRRIKLYLSNGQKTTVLNKSTSTFSGHSVKSLKSLQLHEELYKYLTNNVTEGFLL